MRQLQTDQGWSAWQIDPASGEQLVSALVCRKPTAVDGKTPTSARSAKSHAQGGSKGDQIGHGLQEGPATVPRR